MIDILACAVVVLVIFGVVYFSRSDGIKSATNEVNAKHDAAMLDNVSIAKKAREALNEDAAFKSAIRDKYTRPE